MMEWWNIGRLEGWDNGIMEKNLLKCWSIGRMREDSMIV
jgi:hypothetical protein